MINKSPYSFILPPEDEGIKRRSGHIFLLGYYPKYEEEFYDVMKDCARYIDRLRKVEDKIKYSNDLSRIFVTRHMGEGMKLFRSLVRETNAQEGR